MADWWSEFSWLVWLAGALILGLIEVATLDLVFVMLTIAAVGASFVGLSGGSFVLQVIVFVTISAVLLVVVRPIALRKLKPAGPAQRTNAAGYVGRRGEVLETVTARSGLVKVVGEDWSARSVDESRAFGVGETVFVVRFDGAAVIVGDEADIERTPDSEEAR